MWRHLGSLDGRRIVVVGDVLHSRVARSNALLLRTLGADVTDRLRGLPETIRLDVIPG